MLKSLAWAAVLSAAPLLSGCAATFGGYDLAANGLPRPEEALRHDVASAAPRAYAEILEGSRPLPEDDLLRLLYAGLAGHYAGSYDESSRLLDLASYLAEDRVTYSLSRQALSLVTSDRTLAYTPGRTERLMIPYVAALNYLRAGNREAAAVEARRIEALLDRLDADVARDAVPDESRFLHYFAGTVFEAAGDPSAADVAYRRSGPLAESIGTGLDRDLLPGGDSLGDVVVLVERGFVPHRVEQSVVIVLPPAQVRLLTEGSAAEKAVAAAEAAARIVVSASLLHGNGAADHRGRGRAAPLHLEPWHEDRCGRSRCEDGDEETDGEPYLLRISWPVLYEERSPAGPLRVRAGEVRSDEAVHLDLVAATRRDFEAERATVLARTVARAAAKVALTSTVESSVRKKDEAAGQIVGLLTNVGTLLAERADTRCWHLLPGAVSLVRLRLPAGTHDLTAELAGGARGRALPLGAVEVRPGATTFVSTRIWR